MAIAPISSVTQVTGTSYLPSVTATKPSSAADFGNSLAGAVNNLQGLESTSDSLAVKAVTGNLDDIHNATIAAARAQVTLELTAAVRSKAVDGFNEIMRMSA
ncbi:MAG: flagellar hook-basal body complex protein FliE [Acidobacteria bacterium]|nr:flagellar hook-basal body complex protein FliE [Acidobacteriota bacterium]